MTPKEALENVKHEIQQRLNDMVVDGCDIGSVLAIESFIRSNLEVIEKALTELEELKQEVIERQETEESLGKELIKVGDELEQLKRDVKRFMELMPNVKFRPLQDEVYLLQQKLSKVGKEE